MFFRLFRSGFAGAGEPRGKTSNRRLFCFLQGANLAELARKGLPADYVQRETRRAVLGVSSDSAEVDPAAKTPGIPKIWPGIDIDIPTGQDEKKTQPQDVRDSVRAALHAGADGVILSRKYSEMRLANLRAAGESLRS